MGLPWTLAALALAPAVIAVQSFPLAAEAAPSATPAAARTVNGASAQSHADQLKLYARTLSTTAFAEQACSGFRANSARLELTRVQARITDAEDAALADRVRDSTNAITAAYERSGKDTWCADTYRQFGPDGSLMKGALERKP